MEERLPHSAALESKLEKLRSTHAVSQGQGAQPERCAHVSEAHERRNYLTSVSTASADNYAVRRLCSCDEHADRASLWYTCTAADSNSLAHTIRAIRHYEEAPRPLSLHLGGMEVQPLQTRR